LRRLARISPANFETERVSPVQNLGEGTSAQVWPISVAGRTGNWSNSSQWRKTSQPPEFRATRQLVRLLEDRKHAVDAGAHLHQNGILRAKQNPPRPQWLREISTLFR
jgi:hypothetical protein